MIPKVLRLQYSPSSMADELIVTFYTGLPTVAPSDVATASATTSLVVSTATRARTDTRVGDGAVEVRAAGGRATGAGRAGGRAREGGRAATDAIPTITGNKFGTPMIYFRDFSTSFPLSLSVADIISSQSYECRRQLLKLIRHIVESV